MVRSSISAGRLARRTAGMLALALLGVAAVMPPAAAQDEDRSVILDEALAIWAHAPIVEGQPLPNLRLPALDGSWYALPHEGKRTLLIQFASW